MDPLYLVYFQRNYSGGSYASVKHPPPPCTRHQRSSYRGSHTGFLHMRTNLSCTSITYIIATWLQLDDKF